MGTHASQRSPTWTTLPRARMTAGSRTLQISGPGWTRRTRRGTPRTRHSRTASTKIRDREEAVSNLSNRMEEMNDSRGAELDELKTKLMKENAFLKMLAAKPMSVCFDAYRTKAYDGGGEENLTFQGCTV